MYHASTPTTFAIKVVGLFVGNTFIYTNLQILRGYSFFILQHFATRLGNFINFEMFFRTVVKDFVCLN